MNKSKATINRLRCPSCNQWVAFRIRGDVIIDSGITLALKPNDLSITTSQDCEHDGELLVIYQCVKCGQALSKTTERV